MTTLDRYISTLFLKNLAFILLALVSLYAVIEFIEKVDDFIENQAALINYFLFPIYNLPLMISNTLPMAVLLGAFATIGDLSRTNQLTALLGGGISISRISRSMFLTGFLLSILLLLCNLWLTPLGIQETEYIKNVQITNKSRNVASESKDLFFKNGDRIVHINRSFPQRGVLFGVTIITFNDRFKPVERLQAVSGHYEGSGIWSFRDVKIWQFSPEDKTVQGYEDRAKWLLDLGKDPSELTQLWNNPEEMTQFELYKLIDTLKADGHDPKIYQLESHLRLSKAFIPLIMVLLGMPFALQRGRKPSFAVGIVVSLAVFIVYFVLYAVFAALGGSAILSPVVAAWSANILMALTATWLFLKAQD